MAPRRVTYCDGRKSFVAAASDASYGGSAGRAISVLAKELFPDVKTTRRGDVVETASGAVLRGIQIVGRTVIDGEYWALVGCDAACLEQSEPTLGGP